MRSPTFVNVPVSILVPATAAEPLRAGDSLPLASSFSYQGQLQEHGVPITEVCHFRFGLWETFDRQAA